MEPPRRDRPARRRAVAARSARRDIRALLAEGAACNLFLLLAIGLLWLVPTIGLFFTSLLAPDELQQRRLVAGVLARRASRPGTTTRHLWNNDDIPHSLVDDASRSRSAARCCRSWSPRSPATRSPGSSSRAATGCSSASSALLVVPLQMALIPIFSLYNTVGIFDTVCRPDPLPHRVRPAVRDLPAAQLLHRDPEGHPRVGAHRRRVRDAHLPAADPAARPAGDRVARDLPVPLDVERPARRADVRPATRSRSRSRSSRSMRQFGSNIDLIAPASFLSLVDPARGVLRLPALLRAGAAGGLGEVTRVAIVGGGLAGFSAYQTLRRGGLAAGRDRRLRRGAGPGGRVGAPRGGDPADAHALRERRALPAGVVSRARGARGAPARLGRTAAAQPRWTATTRRSRSSSTHVAELRRAQRLGRERPPSSASSGSASSRRASRSAESRRPPRARRDRPSGAERPGGAARRPARGARVRAARATRATVTVIGAGLAAATEWVNALAAGATVISVRRREPVRRRAQRPARVVLAPRARRLPPDRRRPERAAILRTLLAPSYPPGARWDEPLARAGDALPRRAVAERLRAGDLRDRLPARLPARPAAARARRRSTTSRRSTTGSSSTPTRRFLRSPTSAGRSHSRASRRSGRSRPPTRSSARSTRRAGCSRGCDVVHAERPDRVAARGTRCCRSPRAARSRPRCTAGGRSSSAA